MGWGGPESLKGNLGSANGYPVSAVSWAPNRLDVFSVDVGGGQLLHWWWPEEGGGWHGPEFLGGNLRIPTSGYGANAVSWGPNRLDVFGQDQQSGRIHHWWWPAAGGNWGGPEPLAGDFISWPVAVAAFPDRLDVFGVNDNTKQLEHWWWDGAKWGGPESLGGPVIYSPTAVALPRVPQATYWEPLHLEVFGVAQSVEVLHWWWPSTRGWEGDVLYFNPGLPIPSLESSAFAVSWVPEQGEREYEVPYNYNLDVFTIDHYEKALHHFWWNHGVWDGDAIDGLGGVLASTSSPCAVSWGPGRLDVFGVDGDTAVLQHWWWPMAGGGWHGPESLGGALTGSPTAVSWAPGRLDVFGKAIDTGELQHWWWPAD